MSPRLSIRKRQTHLLKWNVRSARHAIPKLQAAGRHDDVARLEALIKDTAVELKRRGESV